MTRAGHNRLAVARASEFPIVNATGKHPLREPVFRDIWAASLVSNLGTWMQSVGGAWLMVTLTAAPLPVALMQTATSLPVFLVGLPAGTLADRVDRRRLLIVTQAWMVGCAALLGALTVLGAVTPPLLLGLTFALGVGGAISAPVLQAVIPELVRREQVPAAIALNSISFNLARAGGPALAGVVVAAVGPALNFFFNSASFLGTLLVLIRWRPEPVQRGIKAQQAFWRGMAQGLEYAWKASIQRIVLLRSLLWVTCASSLWALLPLVARHELGLEAPGYGVLLACTGVGAVGGALILPRLRAHWPTNRLLIGGVLIFGSMLLVLAWVRVLPIVGTMLALGGMTWMFSNANLQITVQLSAPPWVRTRAIATYVLTFQGGIAIGGAVWGAVADRVGDPLALTASAVGVGLSLLAALRWPIDETALATPRT